MPPFNVNFTVNDLDNYPLYNNLDNSIHSKCACSIFFPSISSLCITFSNMGQQCAKYGRLQASWDRGVWLLDFHTLNCIFAKIYVFESLYFWWWWYYEEEINKDIQPIKSIYFPHNVHWFDLLARCLQMTKLLLQN